VAGWEIPVAMLDTAGGIHQKVRMNQGRVDAYPIGTMYAIYGNIGGILVVNVTIYTIHGSYGYVHRTLGHVFEKGACQ
jgi:hypothetical protein